MAVKSLIIRWLNGIGFSCTHVHTCTWGGVGGCAPMRVYDSYSLCPKGYFTIPGVTVVTLPIGGHLVSLGSPD